MGIEFPLKSEIGSSFQSAGNNGQQSNTKGGKPDLQNAKIMFAYNLLGLKMFGFTPAEPFRQDLDNEGIVQIAYSWDSTNRMQIEYLMPLKIFGEISSLNQKNISLGFKVNGMEMPNTGSSTGTPTPTPTPTTTATAITVQRRPVGSGRSPNSTPFPVASGNSPSQYGTDKFMKEQLFWTKYTINFKKE